MDDSQLDRLRVVAETATYLELHPESAPARRRRDEAVTRAARFHPVEEVAAAAGVPTATLLEIVLGNLVNNTPPAVLSSRRSPILRLLGSWGGSRSASDSAGTSVRPQNG